MSVRYRFEQFFAIRRIHSLFHNVAFSPDGREIAYAIDTSGQFNLWRQELADGRPRQLTTFEEQAVRNVTWLPDGSFLLHADAQGSEMLQIYRMPADGGWPERVTRRDDVRYFWGGAHAVTADGRGYAFVANERLSTSLDAHVLDVGSGEARRLTQAATNHAFDAWSADGRSALVVEVNGNTDSNVLLLDVASGELRNLTAHKGDEVNFSDGFTADGSGVYLVTNRRAEAKWLGVLDLASGRITKIERGRWEHENGASSRDRSRIAWVVNEDGYSVLRARDERTRRSIKIPPLPRGFTLEVRLSPDGRHLAAKHTTHARPPELFLIDLASKRVRRLTDNFLGGIPESDMVEPEIVRFRSLADDRLEIPAWLYRPRGASPERPVPAILSIHGGPEAQERTSYSPFYQYLLHRGIAVLAPNVRGSTGYGKSYQQLIHHDWGGKELGDFEACARYLRELPCVDASRLGVYGGSFGGFATLECLTRLPQYWAAAVEWVGPANLVTFAKAVPPFWKHYMAKWVGDPETEADFLVSRSPITYVDDARCPLLVIQGAQDPRVVKGESDQMVARLRSLGREVEYLVYEDEGHGMTKRRNLLSAFRASADFFLRRFGLGGIEET